MTYLFGKACVLLEGAFQLEPAVLCEFVPRGSLPPTESPHGTVRMLRNGEMDHCDRIRLTDRLLVKPALKARKSLMGSVPGECEVENPIATTEHLRHSIGIGLFIVESLPQGKRASCEDDGGRLGVQGLGSNPIAVVVEGVMSLVDEVVATSDDIVVNAPRFGSHAENLMVCQELSWDILLDSSNGPPLSHILDQKHRFKEPQQPEHQG